MLIELSLAALVAGLPVCDKKANQWIYKTPTTEDAIFGVGSAATEAEALDVARREAAASVRVDVESRSFDRTVEWNGVGEQQLLNELSMRVNASLEACTAMDACFETETQLVRKLVRCKRERSLDQALDSICHGLASSLPPKAKGLVAPPSDRDGMISLYAERVSKGLRTCIDQALSKADSGRTRAAPRATLISVGAWQPVAMHEVARSSGATHVLFSELEPEADKIRLTTQWMSLKSMQPVAGSIRQTLLPAEQAALQIVGPLFPLAQALSMSSLFGSFKTPKLVPTLTLSRSVIAHGDEVEVNFKLPSPGYIYLFDVYEDGRVALLAPNALDKNHLFSGDKTYTVPTPEWRAKGLRLRACAMPGAARSQESIRLVFSKTPLDWSLDRFQTADFYTLEGGPKGSLTELVRKLADAQRAGVELSSVSATYMIERGKKTVPACGDR